MTDGGRVDAGSPPRRQGPFSREQIPGHLNPPCTSHSRVATSPDPPLAEVQLAEEERLLDLWGEGEQGRDQRHPGSGDGCRIFGVVPQATGGLVLDSSRRSQHAAAQSLTFLEDSQLASLSARSPSKTSRISGVGDRQKARSKDPRP